LSLPKVTSVKKSDENLWTPRDVVLFNGHNAFAKTRGFPTICLALKGLQRLAAGAKLLEGKLRVSRGWLEGLLMKRMKCSGFCSVLKGHLERQTYRWHADGYEEPHPYVLTAGLGFVG
jgi:hypothetical protein